MALPARKCARSREYLLAAAPPRSEFRRFPEKTGALEGGRPQPRDGQSKAGASARTTAEAAARRANPNNSRVGKPLASLVGAPPDKSLSRSEQDTEQRIVFACGVCPPHPNGPAPASPGPRWGFSFWASSKPEMTQDRERGARDMKPSEWPAGIDVQGRFMRWQLRQCVPLLKEAIEKLAADSKSRRDYDDAAGPFVERLASACPQHPALCRLLRRYVQHFRP
jgi:hypothetical protein